MIVPAFNRAETIERCLNSVVNQTLRDFELIVIDDGSTDRTAEICDRYERLDRRIKVFHTENRGVSRARNIGIDNSIGKFIRFVDSDDWLDSTSLEELVQQQQAYGAEIVSGLFTEVDEVAGRTRCPPPWTTQVMSLEALLRQYADLRRLKFLGFCWNSLYMGDLVRLNQLRFPEDLAMGEDDIFDMRCLKHARKVAFVTHSGYNHVARTHGKTLVNTYRPNEYETQKARFRATLDLFESGTRDQLDDLERAFSGLVATHLPSYYARHTQSFRDFVRLCEVAAQDPIYVKHREHLAICGAKNRVVATLFFNRLWRTLWILGYAYNLATKPRPGPLGKI